MCCWPINHQSTESLSCVNSLWTFVDHIGVIIRGFGMFMVIHHFRPDEYYQAILDLEQTSYAFFYLEWILYLLKVESICCINKTSKLFFPKKAQMPFTLRYLIIIIVQMHFIIEFKKYNGLR